MRRPKRHAAALARAPFLLWLAVLFWLAVLCVASGCTRGAEPLPNLLFILADDLRWDALGAAGNAAIRTPKLDALAAEGVRFDSYHVASPVCVASRMNLHTGRHLIQPGFSRVRGRLQIDDDTPTVARTLAEAGYRTAFFGKAHETSDPLALGFGEAPFYYPAPEMQRRDPAVPNTWVRRPEAKRMQTLEIAGDATRPLIDEVIAWLEGAREERFFVWLATTAPHYPYIPDPEHPYGPERLPRPPGYPPNHAFHGGDLWHRYYSAISHLDAEVGRLLEALDRLALRDDTLVVFTSDNGVLHGSHGELSKGIWYEEATRQPFIVRWPGVAPAGSTRAGLASSVDLLPTLRALLGLEPDPALEGRSLLGMLRGGASPREKVFAHGLRIGAGKARSWWSVRDERHKLVQLMDPDEQLLYDLEHDPFEEQSLEAAPALLAPLAEALEAWRREFGSASVGP